MRMIAEIIIVTTLIAADTASTTDDIFQRRIVPLARSAGGSSCTECHFGGVDLRQYVLADAASTFAALRGAGLVDVDKPEQSKLLTFIARKPEKPDPLKAKVREEEYAAFRAWIEAAVRDPAMLAATPAAKPIGPSQPIELVRHARHDAVLQSFVENIWIETERCINCHTKERNQRLIGKHGEHISWMTTNDPAATLAMIIEHELIDSKSPEKSLILTKPLGIVEHGGHVKFAVGSRPDKGFRRFLTDYAAIVNGKYLSVGDLPAPTAETYIATGQHLRLTDLPQELAGKLLRVDLYALNDSAGGTSKPKPVATADAKVGDKQTWQNTMFAIVPRNNPAAASRLQAGRLLPGIRYRARIYIDRDGRLAKDRDADLGEGDLFTTVEFDGPWKPGYLPPKIVSVAGK
jgi:hypothetical protein